MLHPFHSTHRRHFGLRHLYKSRLEILNRCEGVLEGTLNNYSRDVVSRLTAPQHAIEAFEGFVENRDIVEEFKEFFLGIFEALD